MTTQVSATWTNGTFMPDSAVTLAEQTRVRLTIEPIVAEWTPESGRAAWERLKASILEKPLHLGGERLTRDEMHERR
ncbi:MAG TPA: hypothetical protein VHR66_15840 [Gemmataceae bacterium]|jgi:hypothetical protein|nr:hypothetical protein [Gemmataceae bacterium]